MSSVSPNLTWRGREELGSEISLGCITDDANGFLAAPTAAPLMRIFSSTGVLVLSMSIPPHGDGSTTYLFGYRLFLGPLFVVGRYFVIYTWAVNGVGAMAEDYFDVCAGGNDDGAIISAKWFPIPGANLIFYQTSDGAIHKGRNPRFA